VGKYDPLRSYLASSTGKEVRMTFTEVEALVGPLPSSARIHRAWWANDSKVQAEAWRAAGWHVQSVNQTAERVVFARGKVGGPRTISRPPVNGVTNDPGAKVAGPSSPTVQSFGAGQETGTKWPTFIVAIVGVIGTVVITFIGITALPRWTIFLMALDISLIVAAITSALTEPKYRIISLWISNTLLIFFLIGATIYNIVPSGGIVDVVPNSDVTLSNQAGTPPDSNNPNPDVLPAGLGESATCYTTVRGAAWLYFHFSDREYGWAPLSKFSYETGFPQHLPPSCS
jgi:hypothetical protein